MNHLQKMGGMAALYEAIAYVVGIVGFIFVVGWPDDPVAQLAVLTNNQVSLHILYLIVYQAFAIVLVVLVLALYERLKGSSPTLMMVAAGIGIIWATVVIASGMIFNIGMDSVVNLYGQDPAQATTIWVAINIVCDGIGGGNEILGGIWILLVSWAALRAGGLPRALNYLGVLIGAAGILSALPGLGEVGMVFGVGQIVWFLWVGITMLRSNPNAVVEKQDVGVTRHGTIV